MPITLTTSQTAAAASPTVEPTILIDLVTNSSEIYHLATQPCCWSGIQYAARITDISQIQAGGGSVPYQLASAKSVTITLADDDGTFSRQRPGWLRGQPLTYKEVFLDVESVAVRTFAFTTMHQAMPVEGTFTIQAEDILAPVRRKLIPSNDVLITDSLYPNLMRGTTQPGADGRNRPIPMIFGRGYSPLYLVEQNDAGYDVYAACVGSAYWGTASGMVTTWWDGGFTQVFPANLAPGVAYTVPWSIQYAVRNGIRDDGTTYSIPVTEVVLSPDTGWDPAPRRFADLTWDHGSSAWATPDEVLIQLFRDCFGGAHMTPTVLNSDSLLAAHSFYTANSIYFDGALIEQRPFEDWLAQWQHDAMTRLVMRDQIYLVPCNSRAPSFALTDANILHGRLQYADVPVTEEFSRRTVYYKDRTRDADYGPGASGQGEDRGGSFARWEIGSGAELAMASPFIGRPSVARRVAQFWASQQQAAQRTYHVPVTVKHIAVEEADLGTLTSSLAGVQSQLVDVAGVTRRDGVYDLSVVETAISVYSLGEATADPDFLPFYQRVSYNGESAILSFASPTITLTVSHQLGQTPTHMRPWGVGGAAWAFYTHSLTEGATTNNSQFVVSATTLVNSLDFRTYMLGWYLFV